MWSWAEVVNGEKQVIAHVPILFGPAPEEVPLVPLKLPMYTPSTLKIENAGDGTFAAIVEKRDDVPNDAPDTELCLALSPDKPENEDLCLPTVPQDPISE